MDSRKRLSINHLEYCILGVLLLYVMTYLAVISNVELCIDFKAHASWSSQLFSGELSLKNFITNKSSYPVWHIAAGMLHRFIGLNETEAAASATAFFNCFAYLCVNVVWIYCERDSKLVSNTWLWSFLLMMMGPLYVPRYTKYYYLGQGTGNTWHNPTNITVKGFAVLTFMVIGILIQKANQSRRLYLFLAVLLVITALAKPSFLQGMIPGLGLYMVLCAAYMVLIKKDRTVFLLELGNYLKMIAAFVPAVFVLLLQFYVSFFRGEASGGIGISFGYVLHEFSFNLFYSFLFAFAFPIVILFIDFRNVINDKFFQLACCYEFCAWLESAMIYEKGARAMHGNWLWASYVSMFIVWMVSLMRFCKYINSEKVVSYRRATCICIGAGVFILQVLCGFLYWYHIATGKIPY